MTDSMKCPICGTPLEYDIGYDGDYSCAKCGRAKMFGSEDLWQELIRTRKALKIAVDALKEYEDADSYDCNGDWCGCEYSTAHKALKEIRALEQKE